MTNNIRTQYEASVRHLATLAEVMVLSGASVEDIARVLHGERRALAAFYKDRTEEPMRSRIAERTVAIYGDPIGPTIEFLRAQGKSWGQIANSACRPGRVPDLIGSFAWVKATTAQSVASAIRHHPRTRPARRSQRAMGNGPGSTSKSSPGR